MTTPTSPLLVKKATPSTNPNRLICEQSAAASRWSLVIAASLYTANPPYLDWLELHWIVLRANLCGIEEEAQNLGVCPRCPTRKEIKREKHSQRPQQAAEQIEDASAHDEREEKQPALRSEDRKRTIEGPEKRIGLHRGLRSL